MNFALVGNRLHQLPSREQCNLDDADRIERIDEATAAALLANSTVTACEHCKPEPEAPTLNTRGPDA